MSYTLAISAFHKPLLGHSDALDLFSARVELATMLSFEIELARAQEKAKLIPKGTTDRISAVAMNLKFDEAAMDHGMGRDGVGVPALVAMIRAGLDAADAGHVHKDATSQDVIDSSFMVRAQAAMAVIAEEMITVQERVATLRASFGARGLMGRTRMQAALPIRVGDRLDSWENNLASGALDVASLVFPLQLSGPVGTAHNPKVKAALAKALGLMAGERSWQNDRGPVLLIGNTCAGLTGGLGKIGADISLMAQNEFGEIRLSGGGTSSAMPHKQNPVKAEVLVSLARFNASLLSGLHNAAVHEQERSGAAWTLEWLVLPQMICAAAGAARLARELLESVESIGS